MSCRSSRYHQGEWSKAMKGQTKKELFAKVCLLIENMFLVSCFFYFHSFHICLHLVVVFSPRRTLCKKTHVFCYTACHIWITNICLLILADTHHKIFYGFLAKKVPILWAVLGTSRIQPIQFRPNSKVRVDGTYVQLFRIFRFLSISMINL